MPRKLTKTKVAVPPRWELFADEFLVDLNATRAAERAGYSKKGAEQRGYELMRNPQVQARISAAMEARARRVEVSQQQVLTELRDQLSVTVPDLVYWDRDCVHLKEHSDLTQQERKAIKKLKIKKTVRERYNRDGDLVSSTTNFEYEVELHDRIHVVELVGKHLGMWKESAGGPSTPADFQGVSDEVLLARLKEVRALRVQTEKPA